MSRSPYKRCGHLWGLAGMPRKVPGWSASSRTEAMGVLRVKGLVTMSGEFGAINVWRIRRGIYKGEYQCEFLRFMRTIHGIRTPSLRRVHGWLVFAVPGLHTWALPATNPRARK